MNDLVLNRVFTRSVLKRLMSEHSDNMYLAAIRRCSIDADGKSNGEIISEIYNYIGKSHRNEYYYKNTLLNKLLLGVHKPTTTSALTEVPIGRSKADFVLINGRAVVYEIKTELDNLERLNRQIDDYYRAFRYVSVVTYPENYAAVMTMVENPCVGIYVLTPKGTISEKQKREPTECLEKLDHDTMFRIMRKDEYEDVIRDSVGKLPQVSQFQYYKECKRLFASCLSVSEAQKELERRLKGRCRIDITRYANIPYELKFLTYFSNMKDNDYEKIFSFLRSSHEEVRICTSLF